MNRRKITIAAANGQYEPPAYDAYSPVILEGNSYTVWVDGRMMKEVIVGQEESDEPT